MILMFFIAAVGSAMVASLVCVFRIRHEWKSFWIVLCVWVAMNILCFVLNWTDNPAWWVSVYSFIACVLCGTVVEHVTRTRAAKQST